ncbi:MAG TPA: FAD-dependent monooxygenase [Candidatus Saccharimonadales bacterium]|nr:FAD-dependent monooxygenase [Candidatus Saccharimonadales bacterium]
MKQTTTKTVLISGAGVAGMALAHWLTEYGYDVTIVERAGSLRAGGYAVDVRGPAVQVIKKMGLLPAVRAAAIDNAASYVDEHGKVTAEPGKIMALFAGEGETADTELMRSDLLHLLYQKTAKRVHYIWNDSIEALQQSVSGVTVHLKSGSVQHYDILVGADGMHSNVRHQVWSGEPGFNHLGYYVSLFTIPNYLHLKDREVLHRAPGKLAGMYTTRNQEEAKAIFYFASKPLEYDFRDIAAQKRIVGEQFKTLGWEVPKLLKAMETAPDFYFDSISQVTLDTWSQGRVVLLGDAAYCASPLSGQGTSLALVGAYVLAGELKTAAGNHAAAFAGYESAMRPFVLANQKSAISAGKQFVPASAFARWFGDLNIRLLPKMPWRNSMVKMFRAPFDAITLKQY